MRFLNALGQLSSGLDLERVGALEVEQRLRATIRDLETRFNVSSKTFLDSLNATPRLADPGLTRSLHAVGDQAAATTLRLQALQQQAWDSLKQRLETHSEGAAQQPASLSEILCAVRGVAPAALLGLDLERTTLARWSEALISIWRAEPGSDPTSLPHRWLAVYALRQLGARALVPVPFDILLDHARRGPLVEPQALLPTDELDPLARQERLGDGMTNRWVLVIRNGRDSLTDSWTRPPEHGFALVVGRRHLEDDRILQLLGEAFPDVRPVIAWEEPFEAPDFQREFPSRFPSTGPEIEQAFLYRKLEGEPKHIAIEDPTGPDAIFRKVLRTASKSAAV